MRKGIFYFILAWPFLWDNATQRYHNAQIIEIDKTYLQQAELAAMLLITLYVLVRKVYGKLDIKLSWFIALILIIGVISGLQNSSSLTPIVQVSYIIIRPFLVFFILINLDLQGEELLSAAKFYFIVALVNAIVNIGQFMKSGVYADEAAGLMYHSHVLANYMVMTVLFIVSYSVMRKRYIALLLILLFATSIMITSHEKSMVLIFTSLFVLYLFVAKQSIKRLVALFLLFLVVIGSGVAVVVKYSPRTVELLMLVAEDFEEFGPIKAYEKLFSVFGENPEAILLGLGPGNYGSAYNAYYLGERERRKSYTKEIYYATSEEEVLGGRRILWAGQTNLYLAVLSEYGFLGLGLFLLVLYGMLRMLYKYYDSELDNQIRWLSLGNLVSVVYTLLLGMVYLLTGYHQQSNIFPLMVFTALIHSTVKGERRMAGSPEELSIASPVTPKGIE